LANGNFNGCRGNVSFAWAIRRWNQSSEPLSPQAERQAFGGGSRRWRRKNGRTEFIAIRTFPEIKEMIAEMADEQRKYLGEIVEDAVRLLRGKPKDSGFGKRLSRAAASCTTRMKLIGCTSGPSQMLQAENLLRTTLRLLGWL
jgi:hypothetical protein